MLSLNGLSLRSFELSSDFIFPVDSQVSQLYKASVGAVISTSPSEKTKVV